MAGKRASDFVQQLNTQFGQLKSERAPFDEIWRKVAVFESERMTLFDGQLGNNPAQAMRRDVRDVDNTCRQAITVFSSGMLSGVSPPSDQWFTLRIADKSGGDELKKYRHVANWLEQIENLFLKDFTAKNFYTQQVSSYKHIGLYGMQAMLVGESPQMGTYYRDVPVDEIYIANDYAGRVNVVYREMCITLQQALAMFGKENLSPCLQALAEDRNANPQEHVTIVHAVMEKAPGYENIIGNNKLPYASYYFEPGEDHLISEGGFDSLPYIVTRAYSDGRSPYSISPGTIALADVLMINEIKRLMLQAGQLSVAPPMLLPDRGLVGRLNYSSGALNTYRKDGTTDVKDFQPLQLVGEFKLSMELMQQAQKDVNAAFFVDLFLMIHNRTQQGRGTPTAMEIEQLATEKSFLLAPILINQQQENFNRLFERVFEIKKKEHGAIPEPPKELLNADIEIEYISPLVRAQQGVRTQQMLQGLQELGGIAKLYPDVMDIVDSDTITRRIIESCGIPQSCIRTVEEVMGLRQQKIQAQEAAQKEMQQQQMMAGMMQGYEGLSKAPEAGSPVQSIMQQAAGGM
ncbi:MAG: portal protein [Desulfovibrio sp.]|uniref:portal protein n=1 Tax=Desulfovibrio sp. TaxID=885 RepID=UPI002A35882F|nr:portal protein [Desulfovibrio sp.]MDY0258500.1 portal protein [Desulfovibrio sp.]